MKPRRLRCEDSTITSAPTIRVLKYVWALPWTLVGAVLGLVAVATGGKMTVVQGVLEASGGWLAPLLRRAPIPGGAAAMTLGHTVIARTLEDLERTRSQ